MAKRCRLESEASEVTLEEGPNFSLLPSEILENILGNLNYHDISKAREVCRSFRDVGDYYLNRGYSQLIEQLQSREENSRKSHMLDEVRVQLRLTRAVCYRYIFLSDMSCSFFAGKILDVINGILKLIRLNATVIKVAIEVHGLLKLVRKFNDFFHNRIEPTLLANEAADNRATLFGSKVIDLLDCLLYCDKNVHSWIDSQVWFRLKGEYKIFVSSHIVSYPVNVQLQELSIKGQRSLHEWLLYLINQCYFLDEERNNNSFSVCSGSYEELALCDYSTYFRGFFSSGCCRRRFLAENEGNDIKKFRDPALTLKVELRCRKELAPIEKVLEWRKNSSDEEHSEAEGSSENTEHDLEMQLEMLFPSSGSDNSKLVPLYKCLIRQKYLQEEPLPNPAKTEQVLMRPLRENFTAKN